MTRTVKWIASFAAAAAIAGAWAVAPAGAVPAARWSNSHCQLQQALFNVRHPHPSGLLLAGGNRILKLHGCTQRVPGPKHWANTQCSDYQVTFAKLYAFPTDPQLNAANTALKNHGCSQRVRKPPTQH
ncbi:MAG: hypothetical protein ACRDPA_32710 [Solirubrobacteraceae bacterium]